MAPNAEFGIGINNESFTNRLNPTQVRPVSDLYDRNFILSGNTGLNSKYNLPAPFPNIWGIPAPVNSIRWLKIKDNTDRVFYIPAYYLDTNLLSPPALMINNTTENRRISLLEGRLTLVLDLTFKMLHYNLLLELTNILSWNTSGVNDLAISSSSDGGPTSISGTNVVWVYQYQILILAIQLQV